MNIIDTSAGMLTAYELHQFDIEKWKIYIDASLPGVKQLCLDDMKKCIEAGCSWKEDYLPVLNNVYMEAEKRRKAAASFHRVTDHLNEKINSVFGRTVDVDIALYLGLCNGAGWVTAVCGRPVILLGIEKIVELNWCSIDDMNGLILHETGHVYHAQYGRWEREFPLPSDRFLWQLFVEGIAMVFEQRIIGNPEYFHQDKNSWKAWCDAHVEVIVRSFCRDLETMSFENQRYFGDWVSFDGHPDVGYYLGARFIRFILESESFDRVINYKICEVRAAFQSFLGSLS